MYVIKDRLEMSFSALTLSLKKADLVLGYEDILDDLVF